MTPASAVPRQTASTTLALDEPVVINRERGKLDCAKRAKRLMLVCATDRPSASSVVWILLESSVTIQLLKVDHGSDM
jgi:hypothetical protein